MRFKSNTVTVRLFGFFFLIASHSLGQTTWHPYEKDTSLPVSYSQVLYASDSTASVNDLYGRVLKWFGTTYNSGKTVIDVKDGSAGVFVAKPELEGQHRGMSGLFEDITIQYTLSISIKTGRIKVDESNYHYHSTGYPFEFTLTNQSINYKMDFIKIYRRFIEQVWKMVHNDKDSLTETLQHAINVRNDW
ncbi:MAG: DUF4468 domain-containing protein [Chitinophagaceae bacterium]